jgi:hypothetical protein
MLCVPGNRLHTPPADSYEDRETAGLHIGHISERGGVCDGRVPKICRSLLRGEHPYGFWRSSSRLLGSNLDNGFIFRSRERDKVEHHCPCSWDGIIHGTSCCWIHHRSTMVAILLLVPGHLFRNYLSATDLHPGRKHLHASISRSGATIRTQQRRLQGQCSYWRECKTSHRPTHPTRYRCHSLSIPNTSANILAEDSSNPYPKCEPQKVVLASHLPFSSRHVSCNHVGRHYGRYPDHVALLTLSHTI